jgi:hypothetical protein
MKFFDIFTPKPETFPLCPSCQQPLETIPQGSGKCKNCKQKYYICKDNETQKQILTNSDGRQEILLKNKNLKRYIEWFNPFLHTNDKESSEKMTKGMIQIKNDWFNKNPNGTFNNFLWSSLNEEVFLCVKNKEYHQCSLFYKYMSVILYEEGKDNYKVLCECHKMNLLSLKKELNGMRKSLGSDVDMIVSVEGSYKNRGILCENCKKVEGKEMLLDKMIKLKPLPVKDCTCKTGYCDCYYFNVWKVD